MNSNKLLFAVCLAMFALWWMSRNVPPPPGQSQRPGQPADNFNTKPAAGPGNEVRAAN